MDGGELSEPADGVDGLKEKSARLWMGVCGRASWSGHIGAQILSGDGGSDVVFNGPIFAVKS